MTLKKKLLQKQLLKDLQKPRPEGAASFEQLNRIFHEPARLAILTALASRGDGVFFNNLKEICNLTDGNLSRHLQALRESQVVELWKRSQPGRPQTLVKLTADGRKRFLEYLAALEDVVQSAIVASKKASPGSSNSNPGFAPA
ncbi:MAG: transcriptional regulator [Planctomycetota bacterium]